MKRPPTTARARRITVEQDTRRFPRAEAEWDVTVETPGHGAQKGTLTGLSPFGAKMHLGAKHSGPPEGTTVQLRFAPPDGEPPMLLKGLVWRANRDGQAIVFVNLSRSDFVRLKNLVIASQ